MPDKFFFRDVAVAQEPADIEIVAVVPVEPVLQTMEDVAHVALVLRLGV